MKRYVIISSRHGRLFYKYKSFRQACRECVELQWRFRYTGVTFHIEEVS